MIIDAHYHLDERLEPIGRILDQMEKFSIDRIFLIPAACEAFQYKGLVDVLSGTLRGMLMGPLSSLARRIYASTITKDGKFVVLTSQYAIYSRPNNESVAKAVRQYPDKFRGWLFVNPTIADPVEEIEKRMEEGLWIGVKAHPYWHRYPVEMLDETAALCEERGLPLLIHLGGDKQTGDYRCLPERHPGLKLIYAHAGIPFYRPLWKYCLKKPNIFVDLSGPFLDFRLRTRAVVELSPDRCIYGTDGPFGYPTTSDRKYNHAAILREIQRMPVSDAGKEKILGGNMAALVKLD